MPYKIQIRGDGRDAWYASAYARAIVPRQVDANYAVITDGSAGIFGGKYLNATNNPRAYYPGLDNCPNTGRAITVLYRGIPTFTGNPASSIAMFEMGNPAGGNLCGGLSAAIGTDSKLFVYGAQQHNASNITFNAAFGTAITFVTGQVLDIWFVWDGSNGANKAELWVAQNGNVPTRIATMTATRQNDLWDKFFMPYLSPWDSVANNANNPNRLHLNEFVIWDEVIDPTTFGARVGFIPTTVAAFEGYNNTSPLAANVRKNTTWFFNGIQQTGLAYIPGAADVRLNVNTDQTLGALIAAVAATTKLNVQADDGLGTYVAAERYTDFGNGNIRLGQVGKFNSTVNNRTGSVVAAALATTKIGVTADDGVGTYAALERYTDFGVANLRAGLAGAYNSLVNNRTGLLDLPVPADVVATVVYDNGTKTGTAAMPAAGKVIAGEPVDDTVGTYVEAGTASVKHDVHFGAASALTGTYRAADLFDIVPEGQVAEGFEYLSDGEDLVGTRKVVTNEIQQIDVVLDGAETITAELICAE